ncbi:hypothetical protein PsorP6_013348 [Peronosclerospora sorghi]|uniref:Uncharacterized protein n=1 Tax=Peronosclerospora sorghi TaxID=230839 RepID=A0ACC0WIY2_9STRA|nr:hypothetical protein PsorP6_013348 [Peronosclerospora sorghi]
METLEHVQAPSGEKEHVAQDAKTTSFDSPVETGPHAAFIELNEVEHGNGMNGAEAVKDLAAVDTKETEDTLLEDLAAERRMTGGREAQAVVVETEGKTEDGWQGAVGRRDTSMEATKKRNTGSEEVKDGKEKERDAIENTMCKVQAEETCRTGSLSLETPELANDTTRENRIHAADDLTTVMNDVMMDHVLDTSVCADVESVTIPTNPIISHLSADEAMHLLEVHQGDEDQDLFLEHNDGADDDVEVESSHLEYQWFDDENEEEATHEASSILDVAAMAVDDVFGLDGGLDFDAATTSKKKGCLSKGKNDDTCVHPYTSKTSSSASSGSSSESSSSSSLISIASSSDDENVSSVSKKRRVSKRNCGSCHLMKQKCVRSPECDESLTGRLKRKRKISSPVIPSEFAVFEVEATDPILKGSYSVRTNQRASFRGNWGFSDDAFNNCKSVSPFEYTSHVRVPRSRPLHDKRPVSGKYGGFFKLRQFDGKLVKIREDQLDFEFLPMPSSSGEDEDEDEDVERVEVDATNADEPAASRYVVLGKGKNCYGRFLIRGYLNPESGRLTVKRRYLE